MEDRIDVHFDEDANKSKLPNILRQYPYLRNAGIARLFSREVASIINVSLKKLLDNDAKILEIKFWGIIYGTRNDYYIAEAEAEPSDEEEAEEPADAVNMMPPLTLRVAKIQVPAKTYRGCNRCSLLFSIHKLALAQIVATETA